MKQPGFEVDHSPPYSAKVKNEWNSPYMPSRHGQGQICFLPKQVLTTNRDTQHSINGGKFLMYSYTRNMGYFELTKKQQYSSHTYDSWISVHKSH